jgi:hypothetical protein
MSTTIATIETGTGAKVNADDVFSKGLRCFNIFIVGS